MALAASARQSTFAFARRSASSRSQAALASSRPSCFSRAAVSPASFSCCCVLADRAARRGFFYLCRRDNRRHGKIDDGERVAACQIDDADGERVLTGAFREMIVEIVELITRERPGSVAVAVAARETRLLRQALDADRYAS